MGTNLTVNDHRLTIQCNVCCQKSIKNFKYAKYVASLTYLNFGLLATDLKVF